MQQFLNNIFLSKARLMVVLRSFLGGLLVLVGILRLRLILLLLGSPASYQQRDILQEYLMAKAMISGLNPYLPLNQLAEMFIGKFTFMQHPSPYPPFTVLLSTPLAFLNVNQVVITWFTIEMLCLASIAGMLSVLWKGKLDWARTILIFFILLCLYPVMVDLLYGQLSILLTTLLLAGLLAWRKDHAILSGVLVGLTAAIKLFTWPLLVFFAIKKDWRTFISSISTVIGLNLLALIVLGIGPVSTYYLHVTTQVSATYHSFLKNYSLWSIGYRLFEGTQPTGGNYISAPPLIDLPMFAPIVSACLAGAFLIVGFIWAHKSKERDIGYAIMIIIIIAVSPISWDHYYFLAIISIIIMLLALWKRSFPTLPTILFSIVALLLFLFNEFTSEAMIALNGGSAIVAAHGNQVTFASSMVEMLPMVELIILAFLLWRMGVTEPSEIVNEPVAKQSHQFL